MSLEAYMSGNAGEDIYGVQNVDMNPFQQADNFDDIHLGSGSNSILDVQDSCMNENEMENLINRQPYTGIKNEPMNFDNNIQNHNIQNRKEMKMNSREDYMYDDIDFDDDDGLNDENAEDENEESANDDEDSDNNDDDDDEDDDENDVESNEEEEVEDDENSIQEDIPVQRTAEEIIQDNVDNILDAVAKNQIKPEEGNEIQQTDETGLSKPKKTRKRKKNGDDKKKEKKKRKVKPSNLRRNIR